MEILAMSVVHHLGTLRHVEWTSCRWLVKLRKSFTAQSSLCVIAHGAVRPAQVALLSQGCISIHPRTDPNISVSLEPGEGNSATCKNFLNIHMHPYRRILLES